MTILMMTNLTKLNGQVGGFINLIFVKPVGRRMVLTAIIRKMSTILQNHEHGYIESSSCNLIPMEDLW